jgi:amino acid transporter
MSTNASGSAAPAAEAVSDFATDGAPSAISRPQLLRFWPLVCTIFFMSSGGPYGLEEIVASHGFARTLLLLALVPLMWSVPIALLTAELTSSMPEDGGFYVWIRRGLGPFAAGMGAWLSLLASCFDMAVYPTLFTAYLSRLSPSLGLGNMAPGQPGWWLGLGMIAICVSVNLLGVRRVGAGSILIGLFLFSPFILLVIAAGMQVAERGVGPAFALLGAGRQMANSAAAGIVAPGTWVDGILLCIWNYSGYDNAAMIASEVEAPQRIIRPMFTAMLLTALTYLLTVLAAAPSGLAPSGWSAGSWVEVARRLCGPQVATLVILGGAVCALGTFNALVMANARLPVALALRGSLPRALAVRHRRTGVPILATLLSALLYATCAGLGFQRLIEIDVVLAGCILALEFAALIVLRVREPGLPRPFRIPLRLPGLVLMSLVPIVLVGQAVWVRRAHPMIFGLSCGQLSVIALLCGVPMALFFRHRERAVSQEASCAE